MEIFLPILVIVFVFGIVLAFLLVPAFKGRARVDVPPVLMPEGFKVPVYNVIYGEIFTMFQKKDGLGWPYFTLFNDRLKFNARDHTPFWSNWQSFLRQWVEKEVVFSSIQEVGYKKAWLGNYLVLVFTEEGPKVHVQLNPYNLKQVLQFFQSKKLNLSGVAQEFLSKPL